MVRGRRYLPFGDGMRSCVGQSLAKMNYTATLALLLSHFSFRLADRVRSSTTADVLSPSTCHTGDPYSPVLNDSWYQWLCHSRYLLHCAWQSNRILAAAVVSSPGIGGQSVFALSAWLLTVSGPCSAWPLPTLT